MRIRHGQHPWPAGERSVEAPYKAGSASQPRALEIAGPITHKLPSWHHVALTTAATSERSKQVSRRAQLEQMLKSEPDDVFLHYALALAYIAEGDHHTGLQRLSQVIDRAPKYVSAYFQKGQILAEQGDSETARETITRGIEVARDAGDAHAEAEMTAFLETLSSL